MPFLFLLLGLLAGLGGCSLEMDSQDTWVLFASAGSGGVAGDDNIPVVVDGRAILLQKYPFMCMQVRGADGKYASGVRQVFLEEDVFGAKFVIPKLWVRRKYTIRVLGFETDPNLKGDSDFRCPFDLSPYSNFAQLGLLEGFIVPDGPSTIQVPIDYRPYDPLLKTVHLIPDPTGNGVVRVGWSFQDGGLVARKVKIVKGSAISVALTESDIPAPGCSNGTEIGAGIYETSLSGLSPGTSYFVRVCAENPDGNWSAGIVDAVRTSNSITG